MDAGDGPQFWSHQLNTLYSGDPHPSGSGRRAVFGGRCQQHPRGGAVLQQLCGSTWRPLTFFSKKLDFTQLKYSAFDRELLAAFLSIRHFRHLLAGQLFHILTDHKPLTQALHRVSDPWTARVQRQLAFLAELTSDVRHIAGKANVVPAASLGGC